MIGLEELCGFDCIEDDFGVDLGVDLGVDFGEDAGFGVLAGILLEDTGTAEEVEVGVEFSDAEDELLSSGSSLEEDTAAELDPPAEDAVEVGVEETEAEDPLLSP